MIQLLPILEIIARGGGGGSGGGSGGGGGGGILVLGYIPAHYVTNRLYKNISARAGLIGGIVTVVIVTVFFGYLSVSLGFFEGIAAALGVYSGMHNLVSRLIKKVTRSQSVIARAASTDPVWNTEVLQSTIQSVFYAYQKDWSEFNLEHMRSYLSPEYFAHTRLLLLVLQRLGRQNAVGNAKLLQSPIVEAMDMPNNDYDNFTAYIQATADDLLIDTASNKVLFRDTSRFEEYWHFDRSGNDWVLQGISQLTADIGQSLNSIKYFADRNSMFYSLDMGWLLIPQRGQLFSAASFGRSDINNHVIGEWDGCIVQLYTYIPHKALQRADNYLIGQIELPKSYGGIMIKHRRKTNWFSMAPRGYEEVSFEWPDFNSRYVVYATDMDKVTSFELLNPAFMATLYDEQLPIDIEVVDNVVYFYTVQSEAISKYDLMLDILKLAYKELER